MAGTTLGFLKFVLGFDTIAFKKGMTEAERDLTKLQKKVEKFGKGMSDIGKVMSIGITAPLAAFGASAFKAASDAAELESAFNVTFGAMSADMKKWAVDTGDAMHRSTQTMENAANTFGIFFNTAVDPKKSAAMSKTFAVLAQDLGSFFNVDPGTAVEKLRAGLSGEAEPLRAFGVFLNDAAVQSAGLRLGLVKTGEKMTDQQKIVARYNLILAATKNAQGDVSRTSQSTANQLVAASQAFQELQVTVGTKLLPALTPLIEKLASAFEWFGKLGPTTQNVVLGLTAVAAAAGPVLFTMGQITQFAAKNKLLVEWAKGLKEIAIAEKLAAAGAALMNVGLLPLIGILAAVAVAVTAVVVAWDNWDKITAVVTDLYNTVKTWISDKLGKVWDWLEETLASVVGWFQGLLSAVPYLVGLYKAAKLWVVDKIGKVWEWLKGAIDTVVGWFGSMFDTIKGWVGPVADVIGGAFKRAFAAIGGSNTAAKVADAVKPMEGAAENVDLGLDKAAAKSGKKAKAVVDKTADELKSLLDGIFGEETAIKEYKDNLARLDAAQKAGTISADRHAEAIKRLTDQFNDLPEEPPGWWTETPWDTATDPDFLKPLGGADDVTGDIKDANDKSLEVITEATRDKTQEMADYWRDLGVSAIGSMKEMVDAFKGGDILGGIQHLLEVILAAVKALNQLGIIGTKGGSGTSAGGAASGARNGFGGALARGGPVVPGKTYMVGENGPEWFSSKRRGFVHPRGEEAQPTRVIVVPSPYFDTVVDHRAANVAAPMAGQAAIIGVTGSEARMQRRGRRNLLAA